MRSVLRILLVGLLVLALPLQGVSAAVMAMSMAQDAAPAQTTLESMHMASCHEMMTQSDMGMAGDHTDMPQHDHHAPAKLKVCGACCIGILFSADHPEHALPPLDGQAYLSLIPTEPKGFIPEGLERPPRRNS